jgi:hypothetical protein
MKKVVFFAVGSKEYSKYAIPFWKSMVKFHNAKDVDMIWYTNEKDPKTLKKLPQGIQTKDLNPYLKDPLFYYRQKPILIEELLEEYELVVGFDTDVLILGKLDYIMKMNDYDIATVINWNRFDQQYYPPVELQRIGIFPAEYFNCSLVACRSKKFAHTWKINCFSPQFDRMQYKEQDILNIMCYFGNFNVRCLDYGDDPNNHYSWYGPISKGELSRALVKEGNIMIPKGLGDTPFPPTDITLRAITLAGGTEGVKDNWGVYFKPEVIEKINEIVK